MFYLRKNGVVALALLRGIFSRATEDPYRATESQNRQYWEQTKVASLESIGIVSLCISSVFSSE